MHHLVSSFDFDFELYNLKKEEYKDLIYDEIMLYHDDERFKQYMRDKQQHPQGVLFQKYGKEKLRKRYRK